MLLALIMHEVDTFPCKTYPFYLELQNEE